MNLDLMGFILRSILYSDIEYSDIGTLWIVLYVNAKNITYFDSFGVEHIPKEIKKFINNKNIITNTFRMQAYDSVMYWIY